MSLSSHFQMLARHGELIERLYRDRDIGADDENWRALSELHSARIIVESEGEYRVSSRLRAYLDDVSNRQRSYATGTALSQTIGALRQEIEDLHQASRRGDETGRFRSEEEAIDRIWQLREDIDEEIRVFDLATRNGYHNARSAEERLRRNAYYHKRAEDLLAAIQALRGMDFRDLMAGPEMSNLRKAFQKQILSHLEAWSTRLAGLIREMLDYLYRSKEIAARTKRMRAILHAKKTLSQSRKREVIESGGLFLSPISLPLVTRANLKDPAIEPGLADIARRLERDPVRTVRKERREAPPVRVVTGTPPDLIETAPEEVFTFLEDCRISETMLSARFWARSKHIPEEILVIHLYDHLSSGTEKISWRIDPHPHGVQTHRIEDILCGKGLDDAA